MKQLSKTPQKDYTADIDWWRLQCGVHDLITPCVGLMSPITLAISQIIAYYMCHIFHMMIVCLTLMNQQYLVIYFTNFLVFFRM